MRVLINAINVASAGGWGVLRGRVPALGATAGERVNQLSPARVVFVSRAEQRPGIPVAGEALVCADGGISAVGLEG